MSVAPEVAATQETPIALDEAEVDRLLANIKKSYGYDFSHYQRPFVFRRLRKVIGKLRVAGGVAELADQIGTEPELMQEVLTSLAVSVTEMFRDPSFYATVRAEVAPMLRTYPLVRVWIAGCATGEEAYSMAILLEEEGLAGRYRIYATDIHNESLARARSGLVDATALRTYTRNYQHADGKAAFSDYYTTSGDQALVRPQWRERILFARHNLVSDAKFNEFNLILCRNVLIYFDKALHARVHELLYESLANFGVLALGARESLRFSPRDDSFEILDLPARLYRKTR